MPVPSGSVSFLVIYMTFGITKGLLYKRVIYSLALSAPSFKTIKKPLLCTQERTQSASRGSKITASSELTAFYMVLPCLSNLQGSAPAQPADQPYANSTQYNSTGSGNRRDNHVVHFIRLTPPNRIGTSRNKNGIKRCC